jgi:hypothetical protein
MPGPVDLAVIAVPAKVVPQVLADAGTAGVRAEVVLSSGFEATDAAGRAARAELVRMARGHGIRLVGPNCLGVLNCAAALKTATCKPLALHMTGRDRRIVPTDGGGTDLMDVVATSSSDVWMIGYSAAVPGPEEDYAVHWDGHGITADAADGAAPQGETPSALMAAAVAGQQIWAAGWSVEPTTGAAHVVRRG